MKTRVSAMLQLMASMFIFGSIGLFVRNIPLPSSIVAFARALIGVLFLLMVMLCRKTGLSIDAVKKNWVWLLLSGSAIGFNWILLFEAYRYTSVAVATLCYYMAPIIVTLLAPVLLKEKLTAKRLVCVLVALLGMAMISGVFNSNSLTAGAGKGILFGFGAAVLYASVILMNKQLRDIGSTDRTVCQLLVSAVVLLPYNLLTCDIRSLSATPVALVLLVTVGIIHTGLAYYMYFGAMSHLSGQSIAIASYIDPVIAVLISIAVLQEPFDGLTVLGAAAILGAAVASELPQRERSKT